MLYRIEMRDHPSGFGPHEGGHGPICRCGGLKPHIRWFHDSYPPEGVMPYGFACTSLEALAIYWGCEKAYETLVRLNDEIRLVAVDFAPRYHDGYQALFPLDFPRVELCPRDWWPAVAHIRDALDWDYEIGPEYYRLDNYVETQYYAPRRKELEEQKL